MLSDVKVSIPFLEVIGIQYVIIMMKHGYRQTLSKSPGTDIEKVFVGIFNHRNEARFIYVVAIIFADIYKVHHSVWNAFTAGCLFHLSYF